MIRVPKDTNGRWFAANRYDDGTRTNPYYVKTSLGWAAILRDPVTGCDYPPRLSFPSKEHQTPEVMGAPRPPLRDKNGYLLYAVPGGK